MSSAVNAVGIDAQPLTTASPLAQISRSMFARTSHPSLTFDRHGRSRLRSTIFAPAPARFAQWPRPLAALDRARIVRRAVTHAAHDALRDRAQPEQRERDVEVPVVDRSASRL